MAKAISIHALRVEGDSSPMPPSFVTVPISIHALRVEGDDHVYHSFPLIFISIHALRVEGDPRKP